ncbi:MULTISPECIES: hypothetical protein [unclassified Brevundimonas]|uniref:hypothetical protein n=1 Tax=unclassified Brevundimonas TaxID=2622653 RepID=UPI0025C6864D|nr:MULTISPECIES: hypothetical protein [unclassified Brevundimonas]
MRTPIFKALTGPRLAICASIGVLALWLADYFSLLPKAASEVLSLAFGVLFFAYILILFDQRLRARGKNGWWLILFFGPAVTSIFAMSFIPLSNQKALLLSVILTFCFCSPFALWGVFEIGAKSRSDERVPR